MLIRCLQLMLVGLLINHLSCAADAVIGNKVKSEDTGAKLRGIKHTNTKYIGAKVCQSCHVEQYTQWQLSDHAKAMQVATDDTVLGDFSGKTVNFHNINSHLYRKNNQFFIDTADAEGKTQSFIVKYTFGFYPLQQYLVEIGNGHLQALNIAWDSRQQVAGGQRWFHLRPEENITPEHLFYWTKHFQNWNSRCAECHSTNVVHNYNPETHSYNTTFSQINVACEACHGPGGEHVILARTNNVSANKTGLLYQPQQPLSWQWAAGEAIAKPVGKKNSDNIDRCGRCHSLRSPLASSVGEQDFHNNNRLQLLGQEAYFADGQIRDEVFVLGSFLQSKMHQKGVTCNNCHNPHSGKVLLEGNALCAQCHQPNQFDTVEHHRHKVGTEGALCVNCHMPSRTYMQVDDRRDHSFTIPDPTVSIRLGVPNACVGCHQKHNVNRDNQWASQIMSRWAITTDDTHWAYLHQSIQQADVLVVPELIKRLQTQELPNLVRASLLQQLATVPSQASVETAQKNLRDVNPLVRRAAVNALTGLPAAVRWQLLSPYLNDNSRVVRDQIADTLADVHNQLPVDQRADLSAIIDGYRRSLHLSLGSPSTQVAIASLERKLGNMAAAQRSYQQALRIEPAYVPALINLADHYREVGRDVSVEPLLKKALQVAPDSAAAHHSYGLFLIRQQQYHNALLHLREAVQQRDAQSHYAYVYAVALDSQGQTQQAIDELIKANKRWPNQYDVLNVLMMYLDKTNDISLIQQYLPMLVAVAPTAPQVGQWQKKYHY